MTDSFKSYTTDLEKMALRKKRKEVREWHEARAEAERRDREAQRSLAEYLRLKGEEE